MLPILDRMILTGFIADVALVVLIVEVAVQLLIKRRLGRGPSASAIIANAGAGIGLLLAMRAGITGAAATTVMVFLALALVAHLAETALRWWNPESR
jgi:hypothetical protein